MANNLGPNTLNLGVRVLSLDGGGAGALPELLILERLMYRVKTEGELETMPFPHECFELIGGSGTGGIIALMLGRLRMSVSDARSVYEKLRPESKIGFGEEFQTSKFEADLMDIFQGENMKDFHANTCKTFVCAMNTMNMNAAIPEFFRSYDTREEPANECLVWEAARATSAIPGLFKPMEIGSDATRQRYIGGGFGHNNPTTLVLQEAKQLYPSRPVVLVTSIGGGYPATIQISKSPSMSAMANTFQRITTDCERTHDDNARRFRVVPGTYFRFNVQQGLQELEPRQWESGKVLAHTKAYLGLPTSNSSFHGQRRHSR
ncbi:acyl transferase/acyl hydrolase/lysophospholipase [Mycena rosella]|uniref:Acyl transferase/acyl hydrolase/lysophospholipase n=1 Tax=Mycena rosella TaxID=1033263 RepID=A0AAD7GME6_MYCRO|nr:acyl transferase/acyl hydrolase/lysophospholipase [Mycena rosella]